MALLLVRNSDLMHIFDLIFPEQVCLFTNLFPEKGKKNFPGGHLPVHMSTFTPPIANFSQSEYVAVSVIFQYAFPLLAICIPLCIPSCKSFEIFRKQAFHSVNLSNSSFFIAKQSVRIYISFGRSHNLVRF